MTSAKSHIRFFFLLLTLLFLGYFLFIHNLIPTPQTIPYSYKQFLLENSPDPKVIIHSGSNSIRGIDPLLLEEYFNAPVINIADNAGFPLNHKLYQLLQYAHAGDLVLLPLEWQYYSEMGRLPRSYTESILDDRLAFRYHALPLIEQLNFIFRQLPLQSVIYRLNAGRTYLLDISDQLSRSKSFAKRAASAVGSRGEARQKKARNTAMLKRLCDGYIFGNQHKYGWILSDTFKHNIQLIKQLQKKHIRVILTWPATVGLNCYKTQKSSQFESFHQTIVQFLTDNGIEFVGDPISNTHPAKYFLNTFYHLNREGMKRHTEILIEDLKQAKIPPLNSTIARKNFTSTIIDTLNKKHNILIHKVIGRGSFWSGKKLEIADRNKQLHLLRGWAKPGKGGAWSIGNQSTITFRPKPPEKKLHTVSLHFQGYYYGQKEATSVFINDQYIGVFDLQDQILSVPANLFFNNNVRIRLQHHNPQSPADLEDSQDFRKLKYGLKSLSWQAY